MRPAILGWLPGWLPFLLACSSEGPAELPPPPPPPPDPALYADVSATNLPSGALSGLIMDARPADIDDDGDLDILLAHEFQPNILLLNDGQGRFSDGSGRLPRTFHDSEDVGVADLDGDGDLDVIVVSEDDLVNELYLNDGQGRFTAEGSRIPVTGRSNAVVVADLSGDGAPDILIGNDGRNAFLINDGAGRFADETAVRLPGLRDTTQDLELGDVDGDGDLDLVVGNEGDNRLLMNDGGGRFTDETGARLPARSTPEETREADFGDVDGDGDLDILFSNVRAFVPTASEQNRLLINDGNGFFSDESADRLPALLDRSFDGDFADVDGDGDLDVLTTDAGQGGVPRPYHVLLNDGAGRFTIGTGQILPRGVDGLGFDIEFADFDGDGLADLYLASRGTADRLLLRRP